MIEWKQKRIIDANIEKVWELFKDAHIQKIMPKLERHSLIEKREDEVGAKHEQTYRQGSRLETYIVETVAYKDTPDEKLKQLHFVLANLFEIDLQFRLQKISEQQTRFVYEGSNRGTNLMGRTMLRMGGSKSNMDTVNEFMDLVEAEAVKREKNQ
ncbi:MAG TPA: SRPBCC family protein [Planococcus sp. (in: firmicutes)]|nr:SRPBCC family protein [Planococcus sp. (in: firmicutes)]